MHQEDSSSSTNTPYSDQVLTASEHNIRQLNASLEWILNNAGTDGEYGHNTTTSPSRLNMDALMRLLTCAHDHQNSSRVLVAVIHEDIETDLAEMLNRASSLNPDLQTFFFAVGFSVDRDRVVGEGYPNVESLLCRIKGAFEASDVDIGHVANRASRVMSYLNYLSFAGSVVIRNILLASCMSV